MKLSKKGAAFIAGWEGLRLTPYNDPAGYATIGVGHLLHRSAVTSSDIHAWKGFTREKAIALLQKDAGVAERAVNDVLGSRKVTQDQYDALVSLAFNIGGGGLRSSTVARELRAGRLQKAADAFLLWNKAGGRVMPGLAHRRAAERKLFLSQAKVKPLKPKRKVLPLAAGGWRAYVHGDVDCNRALLVKLARLARDRKTTIFVRSGKRTLQEQIVLYRHYQKFGRPLAAVPGHSRHQFGAAADCGLGPSNRNIGDLVSRMTLAKYGLHLPVKGESWHVEEV